MWEFPEEHLSSVASGNMEKAGEFLNLVQRKFHAMQHREHGPIQIALNQAVLEYRMERGWLEILPSFMMSRNDWYSTAIDPSLRSDILDTWQRFDVGCELIIGTFTDSGQALLYYIPSIGLVDDPGNPR